MDDNIKENIAAKTVLTFIEGLNRENFELARICLNDDMRFTGVLGKREGADAYMADMENMKLKYHVLKVFKDCNDVCLFYNITIDNKEIFSCGWYKTEGNKIKSIEVLFDPRPLLEKSSGK